MSSPLRLALAPIALMVVAGCQSAGATDVGTGSGSTSTAKVTVQVDVMSGVPNPTWTMTIEDSAKVASLVAKLAIDGSAGAPADPGLGFRGFVLRDLDLSTIGSYHQLRVLGTTAFAMHGARRHGVVLRDPEKSLYSMLRTMSEQHVAASVFSQIPVDGMRGA